MIQNLNILLPEEQQELKELYTKWETARNAKNWDEADVLRKQLMLWDTNIVNDQLWHPQFEHNSNRQKRAMDRMQRYQVSLYPWNISETACQK